MIVKYEGEIYITCGETFMVDHSCVYKVRPCNSDPSDINYDYIGVDTEGLEILGDELEDAIEAYPEEFI